MAVDGHGEVSPLWCLASTDDDWIALPLPS